MIFSTGLIFLNDYSLFYLFYFCLLVANDGWVIAAKIFSLFLNYRVLPFSIPYHAGVPFHSVWSDRTGLCSPFFFFYLPLHTDPYLVHPGFQLHLYFLSKFQLFPSIIITSSFRALPSLPFSIPCFLFL